MTADPRVVIDTNVVMNAAGDSDLLVLHPFRGIIVVSPSDFLSLV
jgi:predicted nucleic acid-binding protein